MNIRNSLFQSGKEKNPVFHYMYLILFSNNRQAEHAMTAMTSLSDLSGLCHIVDRPPLLPSHSRQSDPSALSSDWRHLGLLKSHKRDRGVRNQKVCSVFHFCGVSLFFLSFPLQSRFTNMISDITEVRDRNEVRDY